MRSLPKARVGDERDVGARDKRVAGTKEQKVAREKELDKVHRGDRGDLRGGGPAPPPTRQNPDRENEFRDTDQACEYQRVFVAEKSRDDGAMPRDEIEELAGEPVDEPHRRKKPSESAAGHGKRFRLHAAKGGYFFAH